MADVGQKERILKVIPELEKNVKEIRRRRVDNRIERRLGEVLERLQDRVERLEREAVKGEKVAERESRKHGIRGYYKIEADGRLVKVGGLRGF